MEDGSGGRDNIILPSVPLQESSYFADRKNYDLHVLSSSFSSLLAYGRFNRDPNALHQL